MTMKSNLKGQNVIEFILLFVAVVLVFFVLLNPHSGLIKKTTETTINSTINMIDHTKNEIRF